MKIYIALFSLFILLSLSACTTRQIEQASTHEKPAMNSPTSSNPASTSEQRVTPQDTDQSDPKLEQELEQELEQNTDKSTRQSIEQNEKVLQKEQRERREQAGEKKQRNGVNKANEKKRMPEQGSTEQSKQVSKGGAHNKASPSSKDKPKNAHADQSLDGKSEESGPSDKGVQKRPKAENSVSHTKPKPNNKKREGENTQQSSEADKVEPIESTGMVEGGRIGLDNLGREVDGKEVGGIGDDLVTRPGEGEAQVYPVRKKRAWNMQRQF